MRKPSSKRCSGYHGYGVQRAGELRTSSRRINRFSVTVAVQVQVQVLQQKLRCYCICVGTVGGILIASSFSQIVHIVGGSVYTRKVFCFSDTTNNNNPCARSYSHSTGKRDWRSRLHNSRFDTV